MSNNTPDNFELPAEQDEEAQSIAPTALNAYQAEQAADVETNEAPSPEDMLPPEAQGEVNGGPLGCCLGVTVGLFLSLTLAILSRFYPDPLVALFQHNYGLMGLIIRILMGILAVVLAFFCGRLGWKLGKRFFREYEPPIVKERKRRSQPQKIQ
ncbi:MAG TPA: hypothetical protein VFV38_09085 [Ktedonobacteraceae bacterium]|nr:hypothetical protein [Ktedonobacteraceae bacterium]